MSKIYLKNAKFLHRSDSAENWAEVNPVLAKGEAGIELGSPPAVKIGDGSAPWNSLPYLFGEMAQKEYVDGLVGDITSVLAAVVNGGEG